MSKASAGEDGHVSVPQITMRANTDLIDAAINLEMSARETLQDAIRATVGSYFSQSAVLAAAETYAKAHHQRLLVEREGVP